MLQTIIINFCLPFWVLNWPSMEFGASIWTLFESSPYRPSREHYSWLNGNQTERALRQKLLEDIIRRPAKFVLISFGTLLILLLVHSLIVEMNRNIAMRLIRASRENIFSRVCEVFPTYTSYKIVNVPSRAIGFHKCPFYILLVHL